MKAKAPWKAIPASSWSFTFDPAARHDEAEALRPTTTAASAAASQAAVAEEFDLPPRRMSDSYVEVRCLAGRRLAGHVG